MPPLGVTDSADHLRRPSSCKRVTAFSRRVGTYYDSSIKWPHASFLAPTCMAEAGFCHQLTSSSHDNVKCGSCGLALEKWVKGDIPLKEHLRHDRSDRRNCTYLDRLRTYNPGILEKHENELKLERKAKASGIGQGRQQQDSGSKGDHAEQARTQDIHQIISEHANQLLANSLQQPDQSEHEHAEAWVRHQEQQSPDPTHRDKIERCHSNPLLETRQLGDLSLEEHTRSSPKCSSLRAQRVKDEAASESALKSAISAVEKARILKSILQRATSIDIVPKAAATATAVESSVPSQPVTPTQANRSIAPASHGNFSPHCQANSDNAFAKDVGPVQLKEEVGMDIGDWEELEFDGEENDGWIEV